MRRTPLRLAAILLVLPPVPGFAQDLPTPAEAPPAAATAPPAVADLDAETQDAINQSINAINAMNADAGGFCATRESDLFARIETACWDRNDPAQDAQAVDCFGKLTVDTITVDEPEKVPGQPVEYGDAARKSLVNGVTSLLQETASVLGATGLQGVVDNLLPGQLLSYLPNIGEELDDPQSFGYSYSARPLKWLALRVSGFAAPSPEINPRLKARLIQDNTLGQFSDRVDALDLGDDYYVSAEAGLLTSWTGQDVQFNLLPQILLNEGTLSPETGEVQNYSKLLGPLQEASIREPMIRKAVACAVALSEDNLRRYERKVETSKLGGYNRFIHNQPQLTFRYKQLHRDEVVGADSKSGRLWFGTGLLNNIDWLRLTTSCHAGFDSAECAKDYQAMADSFWMRHGVGLSGYYEIGNLAEVSVEVPDAITGDTGSGDPLDPVLGGGGTVTNPGPVEIDGGRYRRYGFSLGGMLVYPANLLGERTGYSMRLDAGADYLRYYGQSVRLKHEIYRVTLTYRKGPVSVPVNLMFRTDTEFSAEPLDELIVGLGAGLGF